MKKFNKFVGIDWSGAKDKYQDGIQFAEANLGKSAPILRRKKWSRQDAIKYLLDLKNKGYHVLAGFDFAFGYPFGDGGYFPQYSDNPSTPQDLWKLVDEVNHGWDHFYGSGILKHPHLRHYYSVRKDWGGKGLHYDEDRKRVTEEIATHVTKRSPFSPFKCHVEGEVATGSLAGMRVLHYLDLTGHASIWPFTSLKCDKSGGSLTLVEIYPTLYFRMVGVKKIDKDDLSKSLDKALECFNSEPWGNDPDLNRHKLDAIISAAALRYLHDPKDIFPIDPADYTAAMREGWIFGARRLESEE